MNRSRFVEIRNELGAFGVTCNVLGCTSQRIAELFIQIQRNDGLRQIVEVASEDIGSVVYRVSVPNEALAVSIGRVENAFELFDALFGATEAENAFDTSSCRNGLARKATGMGACDAHLFLSKIRRI